MSKTFFLLAPMDDVTDTVFRRIVSDCVAPDYFVTEFVNVDSLCSRGRDKVIRKLGTELDTEPVIAQIWGRNPENFETIAKEISDGIIPGFVGIDLNFGCPAKSEVKNECCSALQKPDLRGKALDIIKGTQNGAKAGKNCLPVSFKTRLGFDEIDYTWHEFLLRQKPSMLAVHVRTTRQMSKVPANWDAITPIIKLRDKISPETKIVLNGDVINREHGEKLAKKFRVDGIMIGRGIFHDPYCFSEISPWDDKSKNDRIEILKKHIELHQKIYKDGERPFNPLKKFAKVYISSFEGASELRDKIMHTNSVEDALDVLSRGK
jgi:tRNA-dihydrouridine synthase